MFRYVYAYSAEYDVRDVRHLPVPIEDQRWLCQCLASRFVTEYN